MPIGDIRLSSNFHLSSQRPVDAKILALDIAERNVIPLVERYPMMEVSVVSEMKKYYLNYQSYDSGLLNNLNWKEVGSDGVSDHALLSNLSWIQSKHVGYPESVATFDGLGETTFTALATLQNVKSDWNAVTGWAEILNKPDLSELHIQNTDYKIETLSDIPDTLPPQTISGTKTYHSATFLNNQYSIIDSIGIYFRASALNNVSDIVIDVFDREFTDGEILGALNTPLLNTPYFRQTGIIGTANTEVKYAVLSSPLVLEAGKKYSIVIYRGTGTVSPATKQDLNLYYTNQTAGSISSTVVGSGFDIKAFTGYNPVFYKVKGSTSNYVKTSNTGVEIVGDTITINGSPLSGGHTIQNEGTPLTARGNLNFVGAAVAATDDVGNNATVVTIAETDPLSLHLDQTTPQSVVNGMPIFTGITFNNSYSPTGLEPIGSMFWDEANSTYSTRLKNGVTLQNGQELHIYGKNTSGQPIVNGQPVAIDSVGGQFTAFTTVDITTPAAYAYVGLATQDIAINGFGYVTIQGVVRDINTNAYDEGKPVYVGLDGLLTKVFPTVPNYIINVGIVEYKHGTNGRINIVSAIVPKLQDLSDVNGTPLNADGLIPVWNNTNKFFDFTENITNYAKLNTDVSFDSVYTNDLESSDVERAFDAKMGTGIPSEEKKKFKLTTSYATGNLTASIEFVGGYTSFSYYINNRKFIVTAANIAAYTQTAAASEGLYFFYINQTTVDENAPAMALTKTPWVINDPDVLLWNMYFEATGNTVAWVGNEKHTFGRDIYNHARNHAQGAVYQSGFIASAYNGISSTLLASNTDNSPARAILQVSGGYFFDEDIKNGIAHSDLSITSTTATPDTDWDKFVYQFLGFTNLAAVGTNATTIVFPSSRTLITGQSITVMNGNTQTLRGYATVVTGGTGTTFTITSVTGATTGDAIVVGGRIPIYYISSAAGGNYIWRRLTTTDFLGVSGGAAITPSTIAAAVCQFNNTTAGGFTNMTANRYFPMYLLATNFTSEPVIAILGQGQSSNSNLTTALGEAPFQFNNLVGLNKLELQEVVPFYRLTFHYNTTGAFTTAKFKLVNTTFIDVRVSTSSGAILATGGASDHALLSNREWITANHTSNQASIRLASFDAAGAPTYTDPLDFVAANVAITGATKTKITYDAKGLVTAGADATTADIADSLNKRYVTDAQVTKIDNTTVSGTNTYIPKFTATSTLGNSSLLDNGTNIVSSIGVQAPNLILLRTGASNASIEIGNINGNATTPYIDFHSGATAVDYDARIFASGGTGSNGGGNLQMILSSLTISGALSVSGTIRARTSTSTDGYVTANPGDATNSGYISWIRPTTGTRSGYLGFDDTDDITLTLENTSNFLIEGGNVGIGIDPVYDLHVVGDIATTGSVRLQRSTSGTYLPIATFGDTLGGTVTDTLSMGNAGGATLILHTNNTPRLTITGAGASTFSGTVAASNLSGTNTGDQSTFSTIAVSGQSNVVADSATDTLTLVAGTNITITTNASTDTITIAASGTGGGLTFAETQRIAFLTI